MRRATRLEPLEPLETTNHEYGENSWPAFWGGSSGHFSMAEQPTSVRAFKAIAVKLLRKLGLLEGAARTLKALGSRRDTLPPSPMHQTSMTLTAAGDTIDGPLLVVANDESAREIMAKASAVGLGIQVVRSAQGAIAALAKPDPANLAGWLAVGDPRWVAAVRTFVMAADDKASLALLRGRIRADQALLLQTVPNASLPEGLGAPSWIDADIACFRDLPAAWLDPVGADGKPTAATLARSDWPKISMVVVSFNQAPYLEAGICSIVDQGYPNLELIMIDGGSTDGSTDILERYRNKFSVLIIEKDRGQSDGLNKGFDRATGDIVSWLNSDDLLVPGALFRVADAFKRYRTDMVAGGCRQVAADGTTLVLAHHNHLALAQPGPLLLSELLDFDNRWFKGCFFFQPEVFFSREIWLRAGGALRIDLNYVLDYDLWLRMAAAGATIVHIPEYLACSRIHELQKTVYGETPFMPEVRRLLAEYANGVHWKRPMGA